MGIVHVQNNNTQNNINIQQLIPNLGVNAGSLLQSMQTGSISFPKDDIVASFQKNQVEMEEQVKFILSETEKKQIEHKLIQAIFKITLNAENTDENFIYFALYHAKLLSDEKEECFCIDELDNIILEIINETERRECIVRFLLECFHRYFYFKKSCSQISEETRLCLVELKNIIINYLFTIIISPENFELKLVNDAGLSTAKRDLANFIYSVKNNLNKSSFGLEEVSTLFYEVATGGFEKSSCESFFSLVFTIFHEENLHYLTRDNIINAEDFILQKNLEIFLGLSSDFPFILDFFFKQCSMPFANNESGLILQKNYYISPYLAYCPLEFPQKTLIDTFHPSKDTTEDEIQKYTQRFEVYYEKVFLLFKLILKRRESNKLLYEWLFKVVNLNVTKTKLYFNSTNNSTNGFILNLIYTLIKAFNYMSEDSFATINRIDSNFVFTSVKVNFQKHFDRVNSSQAKDFIEKSSLIYAEQEFNEQTHLFFIIQILISYIIQTLDYEIEKLKTQLNEYTKQAQALNQSENVFYNDFRYLSLFSILKSCCFYLKNESFMTSLLHFIEHTALLVFTLITKRKGFSNFDFIDTLYEDAESIDTDMFHCLPQLILNNVSYCLSFIHKNFKECLLKKKSSTFIICYYAMIMSSNSRLITNPHARQEIFKILENVLFVKGQENSSERNLLAEMMFNEPVIEKYLVTTLIKIYLDSEKLGALVDKVLSRHKVLLFLDMLLSLPIYNKKLIEVYECSKDDIGATFVAFFLSDLAQVNDECLVMLKQLNNYLTEFNNKEKYNTLSANRRWVLEMTFNENEKKFTSQIRLLVNHYKFLSRSCDFTQKFLIKRGFAEKVAVIVNYTFANYLINLRILYKKGTIDIKRVLMEKLIRIYLAFEDYYEFQEFLVEDERSFKIDFFIKAKELLQKEKYTKVISELQVKRFYDYIDRLARQEKEIRATRISYDDAPEKFIDTLTMQLMSDPVMLPSSKTIVDRKTIESHLVNDKTDPFNRSVLTKQMLIECPELKKEIQEYVDKKKAESQTKPPQLNSP